MSRTIKGVRIVTFAPMPPTITGGIEEYAYSVVDGMMNLGAYVTIVTSKFRFSGNNSKHSEASAYIYVPSMMFFKRPLPISIPAFFKIVAAIRNSDVIHIHMPFPFLESFAAITAKCLRKKIVVTYHMDAKIDIESDNLKEPMVHSIIEKAYDLFSAKWPLYYSDIICTNTMSYAQGSRLLDKHMKKVKIIYQGIRKDLYDFLDRESAQQIREKYLHQDYLHLVTFVGRLVPYKGLKYLIEAAHIIGKRRKVLFVIGGNGPQKEDLIDLTKQYGLDNIIFTGFVKDDELFNLFAASDLVVSPSISELESTPISLLSALAAGTSVIGTSIGGTAETIPDDGISGAIVPPKNAKILAERIVALIDNLQNRQTKSTFHPRFWTDVASDYAEVINQLKIGQAESTNG